jgi:hypothetical protein
VRETPTNVGTALQNAMRGIEAANLNIKSELQRLILPSRMSKDLRK